MERHINEIPPIKSEHITYEINICNVIIHVHTNVPETIHNLIPVSCFNEKKVYADRCPFKRMC